MQEVCALGESPMTRDLGPLERKFYPLLPGEPEELLDLLDLLMARDQWAPFWLVTMWVKRNGQLYKLQYFQRYQRWLFEHTDGWGKCDVLCYRVLNPMVERYPELFAKVVEWAESPKTYVRRAAPVSLIQSTQSFRVNADFSKVKTVCDILKEDPEVHVQKGIGWLLKYAYLSYPHETVAYLKENVTCLSRTTFRYALVKMPPDLRARLMTLDY